MALNRFMCFGVLSAMETSYCKSSYWQFRCKIRSSQDALIADFFCLALGIVWSKILLRVIILKFGFGTAKQDSFQNSNSFSHFFDWLVHWKWIRAIHYLFRKNMLSTHFI